MAENGTATSSKTNGASSLTTGSSNSSMESFTDTTPTKGRKPSARKKKHFFKGFGKQEYQDSLSSLQKIDGTPSTMGSPISTNEEVAAVSAGAAVGPGGKVVREKKIGHRQVDKVTGEVEYKKVKSSQLMQAIQMGVRQSVGAVEQLPDRDLLMKDCEVVESVPYPKEGTPYTPPHHFDSFKFYSYAPFCFRHFRKFFNIDARDFLMSVCDKPLRELSNPGASGSIFYLSHDDVYIIKTVQKGEHKFLRSLLPGYYFNLKQNTKTLLPKFFGLFCYQTALGKNIRFVIMNNILPSHLTYYQQYDLKGSTFGRKASPKELAKKTPTLKDLDFGERHPKGLHMLPETYEKVAQTITRDCLVLHSYNIMDYSLLVGVHHTSQDNDARNNGNSPSASTPLRTGSNKDAVSAHQRTVNREGGQQILAEQAKAIRRCRYREDSDLTLIGFTSPFKELNGVYTVMEDLFDDRKCFSKDVTSSDWKVNHENSSKTYLYYLRPKEQWAIASSLGGDPIAVFEGNAVSPELCYGDWHIVVNGKLERQSGVLLTQDPKLTAQQNDPRRRRHSFNIADQFESEDEDFNTSMDGSRSPTRRLDTPHGGLVAYTEAGEKVILFIGIIDILQNYVLKKKLEHRFKALLYDGDSVSVHRPGFYSQRFTKFMLENVFRPMVVNPRDIRKPNSKHNYRRRLQAQQAPANTETAAAADASANEQGDVFDELRPVTRRQASNSPSSTRKALSVSYMYDEEKERPASPKLVGRTSPRFGSPQASPTTKRAPIMTITEASPPHPPHIGANQKNSLSTVDEDADGELGANIEKEMNAIADVAEKEAAKAATEGEVVTVVASRVLYDVQFVSSSAVEDGNAPPVVVSSTPVKPIAVRPAVDHHFDESDAVSESSIRLSVDLVEEDKETEI